MARNEAESAQKLKDNSKDFLRSSSGLHLREYQIKAIDKVEEVILKHPERKRVLLAMATGTGKTRTVMGLCYRLIQTNRFKRILFLVDRTVLALQALNGFKDNKIEDLMTFHDMYKVDDMKKTIPDIDTRLHFATVQSLVKRLFYQEDDNQQPTIDTYDCIIVDEAHRGYLLDKEMDDEELEFKDQRDYVSKYRMVLDYFDAFAVGLTATPALHTQEIFGKAIFNYSYREAVIDGFLIDHEPPFILKTHLSEEGIVWQKGEKPRGYDKETNEIVDLDQLEDELKIEVEGFNRLVLTENFNRAVIGELVNHLDPEGEEKTLVFAVTDEHADLIVKLFKEAFSEIGIEPGDDMIRKITGKAYHVEELVKRYKNEKFPNIAVTVDLLTTGIDVPNICNLVFMRRVKSRILYEQMLGRATRRCEEIGKEVFRIYDAVRIYEALEDFTNMKPVTPNPTTTFQQLAEELEQINSQERVKKQVEQLIAKLQRKKQKVKKSQADMFKHLTGGKEVEEYLDMLKNLPADEVREVIRKQMPVWQFLDELKSDYTPQLYSEHADEFKEMERGYGKARKPEDYIESFKEYVLENLNTITAIKLICTKPTDLDRESLKSLYLELDKAGFTDLSLRQAWKAAKNEAIAADIISFIRTMALGSNLVDHETRIRKAVDRIRQSREWNKVQEKWLDRFEKQLLQENILQKEDLNKPPFSEAGGYQRLNKIFREELEEVLDKINQNLYSDVG